jgi:hypothetical protein
VHYVTAAPDLQVSKVTSFVLLESIPYFLCKVLKGKLRENILFTNAQQNGSAE